MTGGVWSVADGGANDAMYVLAPASVTSSGTVLTRRRLSTCIDPVYVPLTTTLF